MKKYRRELDENEYIDDGVFADLLETLAEEYRRGFSGRGRG